MMTDPSECSARYASPRMKSPSRHGMSNVSGLIAFALVILDLAVDVDPSHKSASHRRHVLVSHLLHGKRGERRAVSVRAVDHDSLIPVDDAFHFRLEISARQVSRVRQPSEIPFTRLSDIEIDDALVARLHVAHLLRRHLFYLPLRFVDHVLSGFVCHCARQDAYDVTVSVRVFVSSVAVAPSGIVHCSSMCPTGIPARHGTPSACAVSRSTSSNGRPPPAASSGHLTHSPNAIALHPASAPESRSCCSIRSMR